MSQDVTVQRLRQVRLKSVAKRAGCSKIRCVPRVGKCCRGAGGRRRSRWPRLARSMNRAGQVVHSGRSAVADAAISPLNEDRLFLAALVVGTTGGFGLLWRGFRGRIFQA